MDSEKNLVFAWWNTSLAPSGNSRSTVEQRSFACEVIVNLITVVQADFIALGEMSEEDLESVSAICETIGYSFHSGITKVGRSKFDICYISNDKKLTVIGTRDIVSKKGDVNLKVAKRLDVGVLQDGTVFHLFISHWPSRLWCEQHNADRHTYGVRLRDSFEDVLDGGGTEPYVILLGDYNDEPFNESLSRQVMASRDVDQVRRKKHLLYNPFWKHMSKRSQEHYGAGSYYYKGGDVTKWHTFDQLMFSHAFLIHEKWVYTDSSDLIVEMPELIEAVKDPNVIFDHLPVYGIVERVT